ncbi:DinI-like family protein [Lelliottia nimipressuralis]|uniref:DinI-like family protein n=1 Tax=Lelliottia nimipressuralis TaxID=69220 RepID=UPI003D27B5EB
MKVELTIDRTQELPGDAVPALEKELLKLFQNHFDACSLVIRLLCSNGLSVYSGEKEAKKKVEKVLLRTWVSIDDWCY